MTLPTIWTSHLANNPKEKDSLEQTIRSSTTVITRLKEIIEEKESSYNNLLFSLSTPKETKERLIERIGELRDIYKILTF